MFWVEQTRHRKEQVNDSGVKTCLEFSGSSRRSPRLKSTCLGEVEKVGNEAREDNGIW